MLLPKLKAPRPLADQPPRALLPMRNYAFPAPASPRNTTLSSCIKGGIFWMGEGSFETEKGGREKDTGGEIFLN